MNFTFPLALVLLFAIPYFVWLAQPRRQKRHWRDWTSLVLRVLIFLLLVLSVAGSQIVRAADELAVVFLIDASDSITDEQAQQAETFVRDAMANMDVNDEVAVILFGSNALVERPMTGLAELAPITSVPQALHTDLAEAMRLGLALFPAGSARRMVVLSDGVATLGDAEKAAQLASTSGVQVDYVYLPRPPSGAEALVTAVSAPSQVQQGEIFRVEVTAESNQDTAASLRIVSGSNVLYEESVALRAGVNNFSVRLQASEQEFARFRVQLVPLDDTTYQNNELAAFTEIVGPPRILLVAHDGTTTEDDGTPIPDEATALLLALEATGLEVDRVTPNQFPASLSQLSNYASVVMMNVNAKYLTPRKMETIQSFVRDLGGGLVMVGGPESYGMGGYFQTPLEETLPVNMQIKDQDRFPSVSIVIVIDRSGSMGVQEGGLTKIQLAAEGAVRVVQLLNDFDEITVIPVDTQPSNPVGPLPASQRELAVSLIRQIGAGGGGIYVRTGLEAAAEALAGSDNEVKHIILLADGSDSEEKEGVPELIEALQAENVTLTSVSIGGGPDTVWLEEMAVLGNGRFHFTDQAANLPQIFTQETTSIQRSYLVEERFFPELVSRSPILGGIQQVPALQGYVGTSPKDTAQVVLNTHQGDPLLAQWQYGLGRSVAWTSDASGRWGTDWVQWDGFPTFWTQAVRWTISQNRDSNVEAVVQFTDEQATLVVDARGSDGGYLNSLTMEATIVNPDQEPEGIVLQQIAPGRYEGTFVPDEDGAYFIRVSGSDGSDEEVVVAQTNGWVLGYSPEYRQTESDPRLLEQIAQITSGRDVRELGGTAVFAHDLQGLNTTRPIWPFLTLLAVILLPFDIAVRRLAVSKRDWERLYAVTIGRLVRQPVAEPERTEQVSRLFQAKQRAGTARSDTTDTEDTANDEVATSHPVRTFIRADRLPEDAPATTSSPPPRQPAPKKDVPPAKSGSLASRLLAKKQDQENKNK